MIAALDFYQKKFEFPSKLETNYLKIFFILYQYRFLCKLVEIVQAAMFNNYFYRVFIFCIGLSETTSEITSNEISYLHDSQIIP